MISQTTILGQFPRSPHIVPNPGRRPALRSKEGRPSPQPQYSAIVSIGGLLWCDRFRCEPDAAKYGEYWEPAIVWSHRSSLAEGLMVFETQNPAPYGFRQHDRPRTRSAAAGHTVQGLVSINSEIAIRTATDALMCDVIARASHARTKLRVLERVDDEAQDYRCGVQFSLADEFNYRCRTQSSPDLIRRLSGPESRRMTKCQPDVGVLVNDPIGIGGARGRRHEGRT